MAIVNIMMVFDTFSILQGGKGGNDAQHPKDIAHGTQYMVTEPRFLTKTNPTTQATGDLNITVVRDDVVRWFASALYDQRRAFVIPYTLDMFSGVQVTSPPVFRVRNGATPIPVETNPSTWNVQDQSYYYLQAEIINKGVENYRLTFQIVLQDDQGNLVSQGFFRWDPTITVNA